MQILHSLDKECWRSFVASQPMGNIFHTPEFFEVLARARGYTPSVWAAALDDGQIVALLPLAQVSLGSGLLRHLTTRAVAFGGVLYDPGPAGLEGLAALSHAYAQQPGRAVLFTELRNLADQTAVQPVLAASGFVYQDHLNYLIDLNRTPEQLLQAIGPRTRKHIRRGLSKNLVEIEPVTEPGQIKLCCSLFKKSYALARVPLADASLFEAAFEVLHPRGMIKFWLARVGNEYIAASAELLYKDTIYGWYSGMDRRYDSYVPNELLMWRVLTWGAESGYRVYDFGGAGKPGEAYGVREFKAKFGGQLVCYGRNTLVHSPLRFKVSQMGYALYQFLQPLRPRA